MSLITLFLYIFSVYSYGLRDTSEYEVYLTKYNKSYYTITDFWVHFNIFNENMGKIVEHNYGRHTWKMGINNFTDISHEEYKTMYLKGTNGNTLYTIPIMDQHCPNGLGPEGIEHCSYCLLFRKLGTNITCTNIYNLTGYKDGTMSVSIDQLGFTTDKRIMHPNTPEWNPQSGYRGLSPEGSPRSGLSPEGSPRSGLSPEGSPLRGLSPKLRKLSMQEINCTEKLNCGTRDCAIEVLNAVSKIRHVSVTIDADFGMQHYDSGIYSTIRCSTKKLYHDVLVVGYGLTSDNKTYYIIQNTWGTDWGVDGYIYWDGDIPDLCN